MMYMSSGVSLPFTLLAAHEPPIPPDPLLSPEVGPASDPTPSVEVPVPPVPWPAEADPPVLKLLPPVALHAPAADAPMKITYAATKRLFLLPSSPKPKLRSMLPSGLAPRATLPFIWIG